MCVFMTDILCHIWLETLFPYQMCGIFIAKLMTSFVWNINTTVEDKDNVHQWSLIKTLSWIPDNPFIWVWKLLLLELRLGRFHDEGLGQPQPILTVQDGNTSNILVNMNTRKGHDISTWALLSRYQRRKSSSSSPSLLPMTRSKECPNLVL